MLASFDWGSPVTSFSRSAVLLAAVLLALASPAGAFADPQAPSPPRPGKGPDQHSQNMKLLASLPKTGTTNSDIAFWGHLAYQGNYNGFRVIDISDPAAPAVLADVDCGS